MPSTNTVRKDVPHVSVWECKITKWHFSAMVVTCLRDIINSCGTVKIKDGKRLHMPSCDAFQTHWISTNTIWHPRWDAANYLAFKGSKIHIFCNYCHLLHLSKLRVVVLYVLLPQINSTWRLDSSCSNDSVCIRRDRVHHPAHLQVRLFTEIQRLKGEGREWHWILIHLI